MTNAGREEEREGEGEREREEETEKEERERIKRMRCTIKPKTEFPSRRSRGRLWFVLLF